MDQKALYKILSCVRQADNILSRRNLLQLLLGSWGGRRVKKFGLDHIPEYGSLIKMSKRDVLNHIDNLLERGCLHIGFWTFPCISITEVGGRLLQRLSNSIQESELIEKAERKEAERDRLFELKKMPYEEYLKTDEWKIKARVAKERVNNKCQLCNSPKNLNVHHNNYLNIGNELDSDLIVLCEDCHAKYHGKLPR